MDVDFGVRIAKEVSRLEIGQLVVVKEGTVLAVEGFEGTDQCLARGGELAGKDGGAVAVTFIASMLLLTAGLIAFMIEIRLSMRAVHVREELLELDEKARRAGWRRRE